jgi:hypothetical protein
MNGDLMPTLLVRGRIASVGAGRERNRGGYLYPAPQYRSGRLWVALDLLLTSPTLKAALAADEARQSRQAAL